MAFRFTLADSTRVRYATGSIMYFAQGIPQGLLSIAIPVWLASQGVSAGDIGSYLAVIVITLGLQARHWPNNGSLRVPGNGEDAGHGVLGAQLGLSLSLLALIFIENPAEQIGPANDHWHAHKQFRGNSGRRSRRHVDRPYASQGAGPT